MHIKSSKGKAKKRRLESKILHMVRMHNVARDGECRFWQDREQIMPDNELAFCDGPSELAHLENQRRFKTRGMKPELRHTTSGTVMLCTRHHAMLDGRIRPRLRVELRSNAGADGELSWRFDR